MTTLSKEDVVQQAKEAFISRGFWPNEIMWACWRDSWIAARADIVEANRALVAENERLKKMNAAFENAGIRLGERFATQQLELTAARTALAAAEARETKLLEGVSVICGPVMCAYTEGQRWEDYQELLTQPHDDSTLRRLLAEAKVGVYEECAKVCENSDRYRGDYFAAKIRELTEKAKEEKC